jgi:hypothetical protein
MAGGRTGRKSSRGEMTNDGVTNVERMTNHERSSFDLCRPIPSPHSRIPSPHPHTVFGSILGESSAGAPWAAAWPRGAKISTVTAPAIVTIKPA